VSARAFMRTPAAPAVHAPGEGLIRPWDPPVDGSRQSQQDDPGKEKGNPAPAEREGVGRDLNRGAGAGTCTWANTRR